MRFSSPSSHPSLHFFCLFFFLFSIFKRCYSYMYSVVLVSLGSLVDAEPSEAVMIPKPNYRGRYSECIKELGSCSSRLMDLGYCYGGGVCPPLFVSLFSPFLTCTGRVVLVLFSSFQAMSAVLACASEYYFCTMRAGISGTALPCARLSLLYSDCVEHLLSFVYAETAHRHVIDCTGGRGSRLFTVCLQT